MQALNSSLEGDTRDMESIEPFYADQGTPDIHPYERLTPARWIACVTAVIVIHAALIALLWVAGAFQSVHIDQALDITLTDSGGQSSTVYVMQAMPDVPSEEPLTEPFTQKVPEAIPDTIPDSIPPAEVPLILKAKPTQAVQPNKKIQVTEKKNIQKLPQEQSSQQPEQSSHEVKNGSSQRAEPSSSEGSSTSTQTAPKLVKSPKPRYPSESIRHRQEGRVVVNLEVLENGSVGQATLVQSSGFTALDHSALEAIKNWQYANADGTEPLVRQWLRVSIVFELKNR